MRIPAFFVALFVVLILFAAAVIACAQIHKRHIREATKIAEDKPATQVPFHKAILVMSVIVILVGMLASYSAGYLYAYNRYEEGVWVMSASDIQTFYADVKSFDEHALLVEGISLNVADYRGEFRYDDLWNGLNVYRQNTTIQLSDLKASDLVSITLLTDPTGVTNIFKIQLFADEN